MMRVPIDVFDALLRRRHVRPMDFTGKPLRGFIYVSPLGFRTATALRTWLSYGERAAAEQTPRNHRRSPETPSTTGSHRARRAYRSKRVG
jgi:hypothetical protein